MVRPAREMEDRLCGYLTLNSPSGGLVRLVTRRRLWVTHDIDALLCHKSDLHEMKGKPPLGRVDLRGAAITLEGPDCFILHTTEKTYTFKTDTPDLAVWWVTGLQSHMEESFRQECIFQEHKQHTKVRRSKSVQGTTPPPGLQLRRQTIVPEMLPSAVFPRDLPAVAQGPSDGETDSNNNSPPGTPNGKLPSEALRGTAEVQKHLHFLNKEVERLSKHLHHQRRLCDLHLKKEADLKERLGLLHIDYLHLLQSCCRLSLSSEEALDLLNGPRHKARVMSILEDCRATNPILPSYDSLCRGDGVSVDGRGFRHRHGRETPRMLHFLSGQLHLQAATSLRSYAEHRAHWQAFLERHPALVAAPSKELKSLVRGGIPESMRPRLWRALYRLRVQDLVDSKGPAFYRNLCARCHDNEVLSLHRKQISLDLLRTMPDNVRFSSADAEGVRKLQEVLEAFCLYNPTLGYCQGMNFLAGMALLFLEPEDAFWCLVSITERYFNPNYFDHNLAGAQADQEVLREMVADKLPALSRHLHQLDIQLCTVTLNWFLAVFFDCVPFETLLRIWDCFLLEGPKVLFRFSLAVLKMHQDSLLARQDTVSIMRQLKTAAKTCADVDALVQTAFEELRPFPRRQAIATRQACYYRALKERHRRQREAWDLEPAFQPPSQSGGRRPSSLAVECAAAYDVNKLWLCHTDDNQSTLTRVNCEDNVMYRLNIELDSRVVCMHALSDDIMLLGTLTQFVHAYSTRSRKLVWEVRLTAAVWSLSHQSPQVLAGLGNGNLAVIEEPENMLYIPVGSGPVTSVLTARGRIFCACGNKVVAINAQTLDTEDQFQASCSGLDLISLAVVGDQGLWLTLRGSTVLQLWCLQSFNCKLQYDVAGLSASSRDEDDSPARITSILPLEDSVLVGRGDGCLLAYEIRALGPSSPPLSAITSKDGEVRERNDSGYYTTSTPSRRQSSRPPAALRYQLAFTSEGRRSSSLSDLQTSPDSPSSRQWHSQDSLPSSDNFEFDDVFVTYVEDETPAPPVGLWECLLEQLSGEVTASTLSLGSGELPYSWELQLQARIKISDLPVRCLVHAKCNGENTFISCAGSYGDDESVLRWNREGAERLWTSDPILEVCPYTNTYKPSAYARSRMPRHSSSAATTDSDSAPRATALAKVQDPAP